MKWQLFLVIIAIVLFDFCMSQHDNGYSDNGSLCRLPPVVGPCRARFNRYYYDATSNTCKQFFYGGCRGNWNNFVSIADCMRACGQVSNS